MALLAPGARGCEPELSGRALSYTARLGAVQERVDRGSTALDPGREAVAARAPVVGTRIDCLGRATFDDGSLDAAAFQRAVLELGGDRGPGDGRRLGGIFGLGNGAPCSGRWREEASC
jgi:hypothetical protein